jgi:hypothetical protein
LYISINAPQKIHIDENKYGALHCPIERCLSN